MNKKVIGFTIGLSMVLMSALAAYAVTSDVMATDAQIMPVAATFSDVDTVETSTCIDLKSSMLRYRSNDAITNGEVSLLQDFLVANSLLKSTVTGYFGLATFAAVKQYQRSLGISPTGYVGPLTKVKIYEQSCSGNVNVSVQSGSSVTNPGQGVSPSVVSKPSTLTPAMRVGQPWVSSTTPRACTMEARLCPDGTMMPRDMMTCAWLDTKCTKSPLQPSTRVGFATTAPSMPQIVLDGPLPPRATGTQTGPVCTKEVRLCGDGKPMVRNMATCGWVTTSCGAATGTIRVIVPVGTVPAVAPTRPVVAPVVPAVACTMQIRFCPDGVTAMPRDAQCGWHPEQCTGPSAPVGGSLPPSPLEQY